ncbi:hypothetical protein ACIPJ2_16185 [Curtobacterium sp. NPDC090217]|uniref:hypothetical protein n=1 Tax=Curtobacterium sp. NPDC090217 TaxID=3363970 RepID=UPI00380B91AE
MTNTILAQTAFAVLARYRTDVIDVEKLSVSTGLTGLHPNPLTKGQQFVLMTEQRAGEQVTVRADRAAHSQHLEGKRPGYQWGSEPGDPFQITFTYLGTYEYVEATLDQGTLDVALRFAVVDGGGTR